MFNTLLLRSHGFLGVMTRFNQGSRVPCLFERVRHHQADNLAVIQDFLILQRRQNFPLIAPSDCSSPW
jgi:hypothetical protein